MEPPPRPRSLAEAARRGLIPPRFWPEAVAIMRELERDWAARKPRQRPDPTHENDLSPGWHDVVRALEEDR